MEPRLSWATEYSLRVSFGNELCLETTRRIHACVQALRTAPLTGVLDITPAYTTLLITFSPRGFDASAMESIVRAIVSPPASQKPPPVLQVEIPVCYDEEFGPDLAECSSRSGLPRDAFIQRHTGAAYCVAFLGFSPGFAYLHGLPRELAVPRLDAPRTRVPAGSVAIGGAQTGVYPSATPGGWRIIGRTPVRLFDAQREPPALLDIGYEVRFRAISRTEFDRSTESDA